MLSKPIVLLLSMFGILPWCNFAGTKLLHPVLGRVYSTSLTIGITALSLSLIFLRSNMVKYNKVINAVTDFFAEIGGLTFLLITLGSPFFNMHTWMEMLRKINCLQKADNLRRLNYFLSLGNAVFLLVTFVDYLVNKDIFFYNTSHYVFRYVYLLMTYTIIFVATFVKNEYELMGRLSIALHCEHRNGYLIRNIRNIKRKYMELDYLIKIFNKIFGWSILFMYFYSACQLQIIFVFSINNKWKWDQNSYTSSIHGVVFCITYGFTMMVWLTAIIFCCDSVAREADELLTNCYKLELSLPMLSKELEELESLKRLIKNRRPRLTAAGFFEIRRSTLLSLLSTTTTYFIVALQFNSL